MDKAGEFASAAAFHRWVGRTITKYGGKVEDIQRNLAAGRAIGKDEVLHTRFTLDGNETTEDSQWGNFQIDGYGTWLWALGEHIKLSGDTALLHELALPVEITLRYLELVWRLPNYDCWEEHPEYLHPYSLAATYAGFDSIAALANHNQPKTASSPAELAGQVKAFLLEYGVHNGLLVKHMRPGQTNSAPQPVAESGVDSSLLGISLPFNVLPLDDPLAIATVQAVASDLLRAGGGVYRYKADVYYGGGEWILLTAWLGWYYARTGKLDEALKLKAWIESQARPDGSLAEQVNDHLLFADQYQPWLKKWGPVAAPLLWSHAMYIILVNAIQEAAKDETR